jgi:flagellar assembly factor FliW
MMLDTQMATNPADPGTDDESRRTDVASDDPEDYVIVLERGIPGLTHHDRFILTPLGEDDSPFSELRSIEEPDVAVIVTVPWVFFPEYAPELPDTEREELGISSPEDAIVFCPVTLDGENHQIFLNLLGPFVVNTHTQIGRQLVLADSEWPVRAAIQLDHN